MWDGYGSTITGPNVSFGFATIANWSMVVGGKGSS